MKVALVHDYLVDKGGAERVLLELKALYPSADIFTAVYRAETTLPEFAHMQIGVSRLQHAALSAPDYRMVLPLLPGAFRAMQLGGYDLVISSASAFAKCITRGPAATHVCYCYTPPRFLWGWERYRRDERLGWAKSAALAAQVPFLRRADSRGAAGVDAFLAISSAVSSRIGTVYGRPAPVVYPPVQTDRFIVGRGAGAHYLVVSRLNVYKRVDLVISAFNELGLPLTIVGTGPDEARLRQLGGPSVRFAGSVSDEFRRNLYANCVAVVLPGEEDFGLTPLEANASGRPVIALAQGGACETVIDGVTGVLYSEPTTEGIVGAVRRLGEIRFDPRLLRAHAEQFSVAQFRARMTEAVAIAVKNRAARI